MISRRELLRGGLGTAGLAVLGGPLWTSHAASSWDRLRRALAGDLVLPGDPTYATARQLDNGFFDSIQPAAVAYCVGVADIQACLRFAQDQGIATAVRSGGHSAAGYSTTTGLVLDVSRLNQVSVGASSVTLGPGAQGVDILAALTPVGLSTVTGNGALRILSDPVASGIVARLDRPSGNITGFATNEASLLAGKWLELLSEIAPGLKRAAIMFNPDAATASLDVPSFEAAARSLKVMPITAPVRSDGEIETAIVALGREPGGGLVVMSDAVTFVHRAPIIVAAARNNVPAVYSAPFFARDGGLLSYRFDPLDIWRRAAAYVDRILRDARPADLPVQFPTKFEMVVNLKTARALGLAVPASILLRADEVIE